jgi:hypothetical protein
MNDATARTKWCPFAFARIANTRPATNRNVVKPDDIGASYCFGSHCACWRGTSLSGRCGLASDKDA